MKFSTARGTAKAPHKIVRLSPEAFAADWPGRPSVDVAVGLRRLSQAETATVRGEAERHATGFYDQFVEAPRRPDLRTVTDVANDALLVGAVARAATDPNDVDKAYFQGGDEVVQLALTPEGLRRLWDELVLLHLEGSVARGRADDAEARRLGRALARGDLRFTDEQRMVVRYLVEELELLDVVDDDEPDEDDDDDDEPVYEVRSA